MKIGLPSDMSYYTPYMDRKKILTGKSVSGQKFSHNYDGVTIQSSVERTPEQAFADSVSSRLSLELRRPAAADQAQSLQEQIEQGTYEIDIRAIADKIMLC